MSTSKCIYFAHTIYKEQSMRVGKDLLIPLVVSVVHLFAVSNAFALKKGDTVRSIMVKDANDKPARIPDLGKKVVMLFYTDPDVKDLNEPFREFVDAKKPSKKKLRAMGVANLKDTWKPNFIIRSIIRGKIKKFKSLILTDTDHSLKKAWKLGNCDEKDMVIIIGRDKKVKYLKKTGMTKAEIKAGWKLIQELMDPPKPVAPPKPVTPAAPAAAAPAPAAAPASVSSQGFRSVELIFEPAGPSVQRRQIVPVHEHLDTPRCSRHS